MYFTQHRSLTASIGFPPTAALEQCEQNNNCFCGTGGGSSSSIFKDFGGGFSSYNSSYANISSSAGMNGFYYSLCGTAPTASENQACNFMFPCCAGANGPLQFQTVRCQQSLQCDTSRSPTNLPYSSAFESSPGQSGICSVTLCGNGIVNTGESCDNGPNNSDDPDASCRTDCTYQRCGDDIIDANAGEECDAPNLNECGAQPDGSLVPCCKNDCTLTECSNNRDDDGDGNPWTLGLSCIDADLGCADCADCATAGYETPCDLSIDDEYDRCSDPNVGPLYEEGDDYEDILAFTPAPASINPIAQLLAQVNPGADPSVCTDRGYKAKGRMEGGVWVCKICSCPAGKREVNMPADHPLFVAGGQNNKLCIFACPQALDEDSEYTDVVQACRGSCGDTYGGPPPRFNGVLYENWDQVDRELDLDGVVTQERYIEHCVAQCICGCQGGGSDDAVINAEGDATSSCFKECLSEDTCGGRVDEPNCCRSRCINQHCPLPEDDDEDGGDDAGNEPEPPECFPAPLCGVGSSELCDDGETIMSITTFSISPLCQCEEQTIIVNPECPDEGDTDGSTAGDTNGDTSGNPGPGPGPTPGPTPTPGPGPGPTPG